MSERARFALPRALLAATLAAVLGLGLAACSRDKDPDAAAGPAGGEAIAGAGQEFDGCRLIQRWDAHEILRGSVRPAQKPVDHPAAATCVWEVHEEDVVRSLQLSIFRNTELYARSGREEDPTFEELEGIGDDAFLVEPSGIQLHILAGDYSIVISVEGLEGGEEPLDRETVKDQLIKLARRIESAL